MWHETQFYWVSLLLLGTSAWSPTVPGSNFPLFDSKDTFWIQKASCCFSKIASQHLLNTHTHTVSPFSLSSFPFLISMVEKCVILLAFHFTWYRSSLCLYMKAEKRNPEELLFLISQKRARNTLTACWVCNIFSSENMELKNTFTYLVSLSVSLCDAQLCELSTKILLLRVSFHCCLDWAELWSCWVTVFQWHVSSSGFYTFHVGIFLQSPLSAMTDLMTSLLCSCFSFSCVPVDYLQSHSSTFVCFFNFFFFCKAEPRTQLSQSWALVTGSWLLGRWLQRLALGRKLA